MTAMRTIAYYIQALADRYQDRPAIHFKSPYRTFSFTYRQIHERCLRVANYLHEQGIRKGDRILIWSYNGQEYASILLGCALSGVVAVPVDFSSKADFVELLAGKVEAKYLFHSKRRPFPHDKLSHLHVEDLDENLARVTGARTDFGVGEDDIYEIVYTSGTTSEPKGVVITHKNIVSNIMSINEVMPLEANHRFLSVLPMSHMFEQVAGFFCPLYYGCTVTYLSSRKSSAIVSALQRDRISVVASVPVFLHALRENILREVRAQGKERLFSRMLSLAGRLPRPARRLLFSRIHGKLGGKLDLFISGGAALDPDLERFWTQLGVEVLQGYGLTEASPVATLNTHARKKPGSVGRCLPGQGLKLAPENEIWIRGDNVTPGYYDNPRENAARFEEGWYKTGDIGEIDEEGFLFIRGRKKNMILSASGLNVYPEDIETILNKRPGVTDSCVVGLEEDGDVRVHGVLLMDKSLEWSMDNVRPLIEAANRQLQPHQHIQGCTLWPHDDFPRTHTLKIRRGPILEELQQGARGGAALDARSGDRIVDLLAGVAKVDARTIKPDTHRLADLGLDSVTRVELATLLEEEFNVEIDEGALTADTTVSELKKAVAAQQKETLPYSFPRWAVTRPARWARALLRAFAFRIPSLFSRTTVEGLENLAELQTPTIFIANHVSHYDAIYLLRAIPWRLRKIAAAAAAEIMFEIKPEYSWRQRLAIRYRWLFATVLINAFPFSRDAHIKKSFEYMGELIDHGWNILLFPEGKLTTTGQMDEFKSGIGLLAQAMRVPVVPIKLDGVYDVSDYRSWFPKKFGRVRVIFGKQIHVDERSEPEELAARFAEAIRRLG
jgi:long-chain acyl-CoA synthetase